MSDTNHSEITCRHCQYVFQGNFCPNCGKSSKETTFNLRYLGNKLVGAADLTGGFFRSIYKLLVKPGSSIRDYLSGNTSVLSNPIKMFLILGAVSTWLCIKFQFFVNPEGQYAASDPVGFGLENIAGYNKHSGEYFMFFTLTGVPLFALFSWLVYRKRKYNFVEHFVLNIYIAIAQFVILMVFTPLLMQRDPNMGYVYGAFNFGYNFWAILIVFNRYRFKDFGIMLLAVVPPYLLIYYFNYVLYLLSPPAFWAFLDSVLH